MFNKSNEDTQSYLSPVSAAKQGQSFGLVRVVSSLVGLGLMAWGFRRRRSWVGRSVGTFGASLIAKSLGDGPLAGKVAAFINARTQLAGLPEISQASNKAKAV